MVWIGARWLERSNDFSRPESRSRSPPSYSRVNYLVSSKHDATKTHRRENRSEIDQINEIEIRRFLNYRIIRQRRIEGRIIEKSNRLTIEIRRFINYRIVRQRRIERRIVEKSNRLTIEIRFYKLPNRWSNRAWSDDRGSRPDESAAGENFGPRNQFTETSAGSDKIPPTIGHLPGNLEPRDVSPSPSSSHPLFFHATLEK